MVTPARYLLVFYTDVFKKHKEKKGLFTWSLESLQPSIPSLLAVPTEQLHQFWQKTTTRFSLTLELIVIVGVGGIPILPLSASSGDSKVIQYMFVWNEQLPK